MLAQYESLFKEKGYMGKVLELIYFDILEFHRKAYKYFKQRGQSDLINISIETYFRSMEANVPSLLENISLSIQACS